jgi:hypothetical protein
MRTSSPQDDLSWRGAATTRTSAVVAWTLVPALVLTCGVACARTDPRPVAPVRIESPGAKALRSVDPAALRVTSGEIARLTGARFAIRAPTVRAELGTAPRSAAEIVFVYRGPSVQTAPLASGELRRQIGLKLRARDTCNVLYVMWQIDPSPGLLVTLKQNPGQHTHAECQAGGYTVLTASWTHARTAELHPGQRHTLLAAITGDRLEVAIDGEPAWRGSLPAASLAFDGPVGLRSDNAEFEAEFRASALQGER